MGRHLYLRNYRDMAFRRVTHQLPDILLRVIPALSGRILPLAILASIGSIPPFLPFRFRAPRCKTCEPRVFFDLDTPTGGIRQMQMQAVQLITGHSVYLLLDKLLRAEMTRNVYHESAVPEPREVFNRHRRNCPASPFIRLHQLQQ